MAHFYPPLNQYKEPARGRAEKATRANPENGTFEDPVTKTVPVGWKGKVAKKREYLTSTENEEFWKAFSFENHSAEATEEEKVNVSAGSQSRDNRPDESGRADSAAMGNTGDLEQNDFSLPSGYPLCLF